ncbi:DUF6457 domain-containing protein [Aciditerrimonas ferrireducens]|jgi:alkanesulfonate monooxygenase SsuD/methylene tetrahydromethanopterin reductase-like flavin-dependent oxidoreductase (luciferase family)|uniref:DUF6457 domain-containing protein n=1 Tax=Aciditerrimonas ferrireducens TaxID=667306 RepID=UPI0020054EDE|nr:DUF6457 domain-containing protein [Aciditerrimonas ferrireducens]MCK4177493.1 DUF6457 domain-containing protein [Aciditerrimonas ferrireducens]
MSTTTAQWAERFAQALGVAPPSPELVDQILALAGVAAHAAERTAAPVSCWLAAAAGLDAAEALARAKQLAEELGQEG